MIHLIGSMLGRPTSVQRLLAKNTDIAVHISEISSIAENSVVPWHELGQECQSGWFSSLQPGQLTGWGQNSESGYGALTIQSSALANLGSRGLTQNWSCDITEIHGFSASKSVLTDFSSTDEMVETNSQEMINEISHKKLAENLSHTEIRIIHSPNSGDFFERYAWDNRIWLINAGGSHHTAAAKYIASRLKESVTLTGKLYTNRLNPEAVLSLAQSFEMFLMPGSAEWFADFTDAMEDIKATWYWRPAPRQLGHSHLLFLPKTNKRSMVVAALLHKHSATDLSAHLLHLIDVQSQLASRKNYEVTGGQDLNKILVVAHPGPTAMRQGPMRG